MRAEVMRAIEVRGGAGPAEALTLAEVPVPRPKANEILIRVHAAGVNRPDLLQRQGLYPPPPGAPDVLGLEVAGEVAMVGEDAVRWRVGDKVTALLGGGGYAEFATVDARHALPIPNELSYVDAAALPETVFTVWTNVFERGGLKAGQTLLVHGATSGIGVTAIQMAKAAGAKVIATSRGAEKAARAKSLGADLSIDSSASDFVAPVREAGGADVILDMVGGDFVSRNLECLNTDGRLVQIAFQAGATVELDLRRIMLKRLTVTGSTLRARDPDEKARLAAAVEAHVWPWVEAGLLKPPIDAVFPLERAADAHRRLDEGTHVGKVVLTA
ncbi:NAD(P)H-quinone oxidoreductase [Caulobacter sp. 17J80-11]|uniref:NAD(P)H-quinone oxidoreductase n=1 Tax=Caulobacter sp. 17J80-11 TaxID=2763502 RepID=UPI002102D5FD|nr:NAD(P)H-quinone oxidoreductase [Caulobacter sp. 17J80-11]